MSTHVSSLLLLYDGQLSISDNFVPTYNGGRNKPLEVESSTNLEGLKNRVKEALKYDVNRYSVNLVCRIPIGRNFVATNIDDEDVCRIVMRQAKKQFLIVYVEAEEVVETAHVSQRDEGPSYPDFENTQNDTSILYTQQEQPFCNTISASHCEPIQSYQEEGLNCENEDIYETMSSGSSDPSSDDSHVHDVDEEYDGMNNEAFEIIRNYCNRSADEEDCMRVSNAYKNICQTTRDWDAEINSEGNDVTVCTDNEYQIPVELNEGMCFRTKAHLQFAVQGWSLSNNVEYVVLASNKNKFTASCIHCDVQSIPCKWRLHASSSKRLGGVWKLSTLSRTHTCINGVLHSGHKQCTSKFISHFIVSVIRQQIDLKPREIIARMESKFNVRVSYMKAWDARRKALKIVFGSWEESYQSISLFMEAICSAMPGTVYRVQASKSNRFQRLFWAFSPSIAGWIHCRPVLSLDGTFLLGKYRGTLLIAVGIDGNNGIFPLAFGIVESENNDSWSWFLRCLKQLIPLTTTREDLCFISDRHSGILVGCSEIFPMAAHRYCLRHFRENFKKAIRKLGISDIEFTCQKMYQAGCTSDVEVFTRNMNDIRIIKEEAYNWLMNHDLRNWTLTHDEGFRYGAMTTNASESFNGVLKRARGLPIQALVMAIYYNIIGFFIKRRNHISMIERTTNSIFCKSTTDTLNGLESDARQLPEPARINLNEFQVFEMSGISYRVDILNNGQCRCQCGKPEMFHIPCAHVICCLALVRRSHYDYVSPYFTLQNQKESYETDFHCIPDRSKWHDYDNDRGVLPLLPPNYRRRSGRPRVARFKNTMDEGASTSRRTCSHCHMVGHNRSTCPRRQFNV